MAYFLFILVNAALFIRPAEIVPAWQAWEVYFYLIVTCFAVALPDVLRYFTAQSLDTQPITLCVFGLLVAIFASSAVNTDAAETWRTSFFFAKVIVYYILFVSLVTTAARLQTLLICMLAFCGCVTILAVLRFHDLIHLETIKPLLDVRDGQYGDTITVKRLQGTGIFHDPNELCVLLAAMIPLSLYFLVWSKNLLVRGMCLASVPLFGYAVMLTGSRGGFLAFVGGLGALAWTRFGWKKTALLSAIGLPVLFILFAGRQTELSTGTNTASTRVGLWREWLTVFKENPAFGTGMTLRPEEDPQTKRPDLGKKHLAHNSYIQSFADLGFIGGCLFVGAFMLAGWSVYRFNAKDSLIQQHELKDVQPFLLASLAAYGLGMASLSICYMIPTYLMLALTVAYTRMAQRSALSAPAPLRFDLPQVGRIGAAGVFTLFSIYVFVRFLA
ncbi:MAG: O-antigen ligase family protein [Planctomycetes bacterium]|nr:O-antigen ligase family protein [Planctomycetota bacterium]